MNVIKEKIKYLISLSYPQYNSNSDYIEDNFIKDTLIEIVINELKILSEKNNTILGQIIKFPAGNSYAMYVICNIKNNNVGLSWINYKNGYQIDKLTEFGELPLEQINYLL